MYLFLFVDVTESEVESVKKILLSQLGTGGVTESVIKVLDKLTNKISSLEKICRIQEQQLRRAEAHQVHILIYNRIYYFPF